MIGLRRQRPEDELARVVARYEEKLRARDRHISSLQAQVRSLGSRVDRWKSLYRDLAADRVNQCQSCRDRALALAAGSAPLTAVGDRPAASGGAQGSRVGEVSDEYKPLHLLGSEVGRG